LFFLLLDILVFFNFFFFQAEDGIRDLIVTGVQTCALPIFEVDTSLGSPLALTIRSSTRRTRSPPSEVSTSMAGHSRVHSSTRVNIRIIFPGLTQSLTKSMDQRSFGRVAAGLVTIPFQWIRRRCRILIANPSSRYSRYTRLWLAGIPSRTSIAVSRR